MPQDTPFETTAQRAIVMAKALLSKASKEYHDDVKNHPSEGELAQALMVVMPYFASIHIPETGVGEFGGLMLTAEPTERLALLLRPCGQIDDGHHGMAACLYKPDGVSGEAALKMLAAVIMSMKDEVEAHDAKESVKH